MGCASTLQFSDIIGDNWGGREKGLPYEQGHYGGAGLVGSGEMRNVRPGAIQMW